MKIHHQHSISDFRYLDVALPVDRAQIERGLREMGTDPEVISWFFSEFEDLQARYAASRFRPQFLIRQ